MRKFREKPVVVDAWQFRRADPSTHAHVNFSRPGAGDGGPRLLVDGKYWVGTLGSPHIVTDGDWIIRDVMGNLCSCKPDVFAATYELAED